MSSIHESLKTASLVVKKQYCRHAEYHFISPRKTWERLLCIDQRDVFSVSPRHINLMYLYSVFNRGPFQMVGQVIACNGLANVCRPILPDITARITINLCIPKPLFALGTGGILCLLYGRLPPNCFAALRFFKSGACQPTGIKTSLEMFIRGLSCITSFIIIIPPYFTECTSLCNHRTTPINGRRKIAYNGSLHSGPLRQMF